MSVIRYKLKHPIHIGEGETISEIVSEHRPRMKTIKAILKVPENVREGESIELILDHMFGLSPRISDRMDIEDGLAVMGLVMEAYPFLSSGAGSADISHGPEDGSEILPE